jgi:hypothetical protein
LYVAFDVGFSACRLSQYVTAYVAGNLVHGVAENQLLVAALGAFYAHKGAAWLGYKFIPFTHDIFLLL